MRSSEASGNGGEVGAGSSQMNSQNKERLKPFKIKSVAKGHYSNDFKVKREFVPGGFGKVAAVEELSTNKTFAIKRIALNAINGVSEPKIKKELLREVSFLIRARSNYVVHYFDSWIEDNKMLYIQMELCSKDLFQLIEDKRHCFNRKSTQVMNVIEYFISGQLFKEIVECVQYLHKIDIFHRDLKPKNILINEKPINGRFVKVGDFGLAKMASNQTMTHTANMGTDVYMAPEVKEAQYSNKSDVYSLGKIAQFDLFDIEKLSKFTKNKELKQKRKTVVELITAMITSPNTKVRPSCDHILSSFNDWGIHANDLDKFTIKPCDLQTLKVKEFANIHSFSFKNSFFLDYYELKSKKTSSELYSQSDKLVSIVLDKSTKNKSTNKTNKRKPKSDGNQSKTKKPKKT